MKRKIEYKTVDFTCRAEDGERKKLRGLAVVFNSETTIGTWFREVIRPGALTKTLGERDVKMLWNHDSNFPMGSTKAGTLGLYESARGLEVDNDPPTQGMYAGFVEAIERGDVSQMSFGFQVIRENVIEEEGKLPLREITEIKLYEVSPVTFPAYADTEISARAESVFDGWVRDGKIAAPQERTATEANDDTTSVAPLRDSEHPTEPGEAASFDGVPEWVLNRCELDAAEEELNDAN